MIKAVKHIKQTVEGNLLFIRWTDSNELFAEYLDNLNMYIFKYSNYVLK
jgi:hypothetical protein